MLKIFIEYNSFSTGIFFNKGVNFSSKFFLPRKKNCCWFKIPSNPYSGYVRKYDSSLLIHQPPWRICFFGTDDYALKHLKTLYENKTGGDKKIVSKLDVVIPKSGKCPVEKFASQNNLKIMKWPLESLGDQYDVGLVVSFGHMIPFRVINAFPYGILNIHPSILPRWRGASPIIHTILNGDEETGISVMEIRPKHFDVGPLLLQSKFLIPEGSSNIQLRGYLANEGSKMMIKALEDLPNLEKMEYEQNQYGITYANKLNAKNARINWNSQTLLNIDRQYRALSDTFGLRTLWNSQKIKLTDMIPFVEMIDQKVLGDLEREWMEDREPIPGTCFYLHSLEILCIKCKDSWAGFKSIVFKKPMTSKSFYNGYLSKESKKFILFQSQENYLEKFICKIPAFPPSLKKRQFSF